MKLFIRLTFIMLLLSSCSSLGNHSRSTGLQDKAFLSFVAAEDGKAEVSIDNAPTFTVKVNKSSKSYNQVYKNNCPIEVGTHTVTVYQNGKKVFEKKIFVSTQEVKKIEI